MYKLFLTFRYLTRKKIVLFPILVVALCVMMLLIVTSIMTGFVQRVRDANRDLYGDIVISSGSSTRGFAGYQELSDALKARFPQIKATTPVVKLYGLIYVPAAGQTRYMQLVGVRPEERSDVTSFRTTLYQQYRAPVQAVQDLTPRLPATAAELVTFAAKNYENAEKAWRAAEDAKWKLNARYIDLPPGQTLRPAADARWLWGLIPLALIAALLFFRATRQRNFWGYLTASVTTLLLAVIIVAGLYWPIWFPHESALAADRAHIADLAFRQAIQTLRFSQKLPDATYTSPKSLSDAILPPAPSFTVPPDAALSRQERKSAGIQEGDLSPIGCIVGSQIGFYRRDSRGNFERPINQSFPAATITVFPANRRTGQISASKENAVSQPFTIIDDSHTGVYDEDAFNVYADFSLVQRMADMAPDPDFIKENPSANFAPLCHELLIKLSTDMSSADMKDLRAQITSFVDKFAAEPENLPKNLDGVDVQTWDEKQAKYLGAVQNEKVMMTFILLLMSVVVIVVIFLIFYQIVRDKTRDIGIIKAVGGSEEGVAGIFLTYGLFIGLVGGGIGVLAGAAFVTHTNQIHEAIYQLTGIIIWDRSVYLFDRIPDTVYTSDVITYYALALVAGVLGALIPAAVAGSEDPVKAVRYE